MVKTHRFGAAHLRRLGAGCPGPDGRGAPLRGPGSGGYFLAGARPLPGTMETAFFFFFLTPAVLLFLLLHP